MLLHAIECELLDANSALNHSAAGLWLKVLAELLSFLEVPHHIETGVSSSGSRISTDILYAVMQNQSAPARSCMIGPEISLALLASISTKGYLQKLLHAHRAPRRS